MEDIKARSEQPPPAPVFESSKKILISGGDISEDPDAQLNEPAVPQIQSTPPPSTSEQPSPEATPTPGLKIDAGGNFGGEVNPGNIDDVKK